MEESAGQWRAALRGHRATRRPGPAAVHLAGDGRGREWGARVPPCCRCLRRAGEIPHRTRALRRAADYDPAYRCAHRHGDGPAGERLCAVHEFDRRGRNRIMELLVKEVGFGLMLVIAMAIYAVPLAVLY